MNRTAQIFRLPKGLSTIQQVEYSLSIIQKLRNELILLRKKTTYCQKHHNTCDEKIEAWKRKYQQEHEEKEKLRKEYDNIMSENEKLKQELEKKEKTTQKLLKELFLHGNFKKKTPGQRKNGGKFGHKDTNQDSNRYYSSFPKKLVYTTHWGKLVNNVNRVQGFKTKVFIDIKINTNLSQLLLEIELQWCDNCHE